MTEHEIADGIMDGLPKHPAHPLVDWRHSDSGVRHRDRIATALSSAREAGKREGIEKAAEVCRAEANRWYAVADQLVEVGRLQEAALELAAANIAEASANAILSLSPSPTDKDEWRDMCGELSGEIPDDAYSLRAPPADGEG